MFEPVPYHLIINSLKGKLNVSEEALLQEWLEVSEENKVSYDQISEIWNTSNYFKEDQMFDDQKAFEKFKIRTNLEKPVIEENLRPGKAQIIQIKPVYRWVALAATLMLIVGALFVWNSFFRNPIVEFSASKGDVVKLSLPDGSEAWLNENSTIKYNRRFSGNKRNLLLDGNAYFEVTPDPENPFIVELEDAVITVLGTSFEILNENNKVIVNVDEGKVQLSTRSSEKSVILNELEQGIYNKSNAYIGKNKLFTTNHASWKTGGLSFIRTPLFIALDEIESYYEVQIEYSRSDLRGLSWTSPNLKNSPIEEVFDIIQSNFPLEIEEISENSFRVVKK